MPLKNHLNNLAIESIAQKIKSVCPSFKVNTFFEHTLKNDWEKKELKARIRALTEGFGKVCPGNYQAKLKVAQAVAPLMKGFEGWFLTDFVEVYGQEHFEMSVEALKFLTPYFSSEFAIRPYIEKNQVVVMKQMLKWSKDQNEHVRRFSSEGCRPRLPWGRKLEGLVKDPSSVFHILENLKADASLYVRKSVANNLNDISKDHPDRVIAWAKKNIGKNENTDWILKHALRTLLKKGDARALELFQLNPVEQVSVKKVEFLKPNFKIGESLTFKVSFFSKASQKIRLEYKIYYVQKTGLGSGKVFQLREGQFKTGRHTVVKKHSLKQMTTRKHYPGEHVFELLMNGQVKQTSMFTLKA